MPTRYNTRLATLDLDAPSPAGWAETLCDATRPLDPTALRKGQFLIPLLPEDSFSLEDTDIRVAHGLTRYVIPDIWKFQAIDQTAQTVTVTSIFQTKFGARVIPMADLAYLYPFLLMASTRKGGVKPKAGAFYLTPDAQLIQTNKSGIYTYDAEDDSTPTLTFTKHVYHSGFTLTAEMIYDGSGWNTDPQTPPDTPPVVPTAVVE